MVVYVLLDITHEYRVLGVFSDATQFLDKELWDTEKKLQLIPFQLDDTSPSLFRSIWCYEKGSWKEIPT